MMLKHSEGESMTADQPGPPHPPQGSSPYQGQEWQGEPAAGKKKKKKKRIFLWFFLAIQAIFIYWVIGGAHAASTSTRDCGSLSAKACQQAADAGTGVGVFLIIFLWVLVDIILGIGYGVYKLASRR